LITTGEAEDCAVGNFCGEGAGESMAKERDTLIPILQQFGVPNDGILIVHSAIAMLSRQGFAANGIIETLLDHCEYGNVFMPTMTWRTVTPANPHWDEISTPSHTGVLTEIFRTTYSTARSIHVITSIARLCQTIVRTD
jgi:aminoglycoside 3-N-acetyltransferase